MSLESRRNAAPTVKVIAAWMILLLSPFYLGATEGALIRLQYNNPGLVVDLGVGLWAWPMPMDFDGDGDFDLVVVCPDKPCNGTYFFENSQGNVKMPVFESPVRISEGKQNVQVSYVNGEPRVLSPGMEHTDFFNRGLEVQKSLDVDADDVYKTEGRIRAKMWKYGDSDRQQREGPTGRGGRIKVCKDIPGADAVEEYPGVILGI
jgi:hypothetical protein